MGSAHAAGSEVAGVEAMTAAGSLVKALGRGLPSDRLVLTEDICVPRSKVPAMLEQMSATRPGMACGSPRSRTPATGTCTR